MTTWASPSVISTSPIFTELFPPPPPVESRKFASPLAVSAAIDLRRRRARSSAAPGHHREDTPGDQPGSSTREQTPTADRRSASRAGWRPPRRRRSLARPDRGAHEDELIDTFRPIAAEARDCTIGMNQSQFQKTTSSTDQYNWDADPGQTSRGAGTCHASGTAPGTRAVFPNAYQKSSTGGLSRCGPAPRARYSVECCAPGQASLQALCDQWGTFRRQCLIQVNARSKEGSHTWQAERVSHGAVTPLNRFLERSADA